MGEATKEKVEVLENPGTYVRTSLLHEDVREVRKVKSRPRKEPRDRRLVYH